MSKSLPFLNLSMMLASIFRSFAFPNRFSLIKLFLFQLIQMKNKIRCHVFLNWFIHPNVYFWNKIATTLFSLAYDLEVWDFIRVICAVNYNESKCFDIFHNSQRFIWFEWLIDYRRYMCGLVTTLQNWDTCMQQLPLVL